MPPARETHVRALSIAAPLLLALVGCPLEPRVVDLRPDTGSPGNTDDTQSRPVIMITTGSLDFGGVSVGEHHEKTLTIYNTGDAALSIEEVEIVEDDVPFSFEQLELAWLEPDRSAALVLAFEPIAHGFANGTLSIQSDDPSQPVLTVDLNGQGMAPLLQVLPSAVALGPTWIGCGASERLVLYNSGNEGLFVNAVDFEASSQELQLVLAEMVNGPLPWSLGAETTKELGTVSHAPGDERQDQAFITVTSSDSRVEAVRVNVLADAAAWAVGLDSFTVPSGVVDVVVALDRSTSMDSYLPALLAGLPDLVAGLAGRGLDLQLAVVVDDDGCVNGSVGWIDHLSSSSEVQDAITDMSTHHGGGALTERAFLMLAEALSVDNLAVGGCDEGLLRDSSALHLLGISDEAEQSTGAWFDHVAALQALRSDSELVMFHAIAGDDSGCGTESYGGFEDAVDLTGGALASLCSDDLAGELDAMAGVMASVAGDPASEGPYTLSQQPVAASILVRVDETTLTEGWAYDEDSNSVSFEAVQAPSPGAVVEFSYAVWPEDCSAP